MATVFLVFFVFAILSHFAKTEQVDCPVHKVSSARRFSWFSPRSMYAMRACVTFNEPPVQNCMRASDSAVTFSVTGVGGPASISTPFTPAKVNKRFCHIYNPCEIAKLLATPLIWTWATAEVYAFDKVQDPKSPLLNVTLTETRWNATGPGMYKEVEHELLSVICHSPNCTVKSEGYGGDNKYYFPKVGDNFPQCVDKENHEWSVTTFLCDPKCSRTYTTATSSIDAPPRPKPTEDLPPPPPPPTVDTTPTGPAAVPAAPAAVPAAPPTRTATKAPKAPAAAATTQKSNAVPHLNIRTLLTVAALALLA